MNYSLIQIERAADAVVVTPLGDLGSLSHRPSDWEAAKQALEDAESRHVVVDFHQTKYFGAAALSVLMELWKKVKSRGGQMVLCGVSDVHRQILAAARLDHVWPIHADRQRALARIRGDADLAGYRRN